MKNSIVELEKKAYQYRTRFLEIFSNIGFGHITSAYSWTEIATVLYNEIMKVPCSKNDVDNSDRMVVSKGHGAGILFPIFEDLGIFTKSEMDRMVCIGGNKTQLSRLFYPGFDFYGGSLGIGIGVATGLAKADKLSGNNKKTFCILGDAECYEGSVWEAAAFAGHNELNNLIAIVDYNRLGCSDFTENMVALDPFVDKWKSFGWNVASVINGNDIASIYDVLFDIVKSDDKRPKCVIASTRKGQGVPALIDKPLKHGYMPVKKEEVEAVYRALKDEYE